MLYVEGCQNYRPLIRTILETRDRNFDNLPCMSTSTKLGQVGYAVRVQATQLAALKLIDLVPF